MPAPNPLTSNDQIRSWVTAINTWFNYLVGLITNLTSGHIHNGTDSRKIDHINLNSIGTNTHSQIDTAVTNSTNHIADSASHVTSQNKTDWNGIKTEVENARNSTAKSITYETLDARLEAIETSSTPESHNNLSGRDTEATSSDSEDHSHLAQALWDSTESQTVQDTLDEKLTGSDLKNAINALTDNDIDGAKIETATDEAKGTLLLGAEGGAATFDHTHDDTTIESSHYHHDFGMPIPTKLYVQDRLNAINQGAQLVNEVLNGTFTFAGYDGSNNVHTLGQAVASASKQNGIPGWHVGSGSHANFLARVQTTDLGTPPWGDFETTTLRHRGRHGNAIVEFHSSDWTATQSNIFYSDTMCIDANKTYTIMYWYRHVTATTTSHLGFWLEYWDGSAWREHYAANMQPFFGGNNDTNWHQVLHTGFIGDAQFIRLKFTITGGATAQDIQIARVGCFQGIWESAEHIMPEAWYSAHIDRHTSINTSTGTNSFPTSLNTWVDWLAYKKTYITSTTVNSSFIGSVALVIPDCHYIYNIKVTPSYQPTTTVPTVPPTVIPSWYSYWQQSSGQNFNDILSAINVYFPPPNSGSGTVTIEVDYWPADIPDADLP